ncbi:MAG: glycosyltransferase family 39 protein [Solirubrobacterales bacterium]|nr:glycosyltransferase family 39 protein [Solirubrobacterales bacterium]
MANTYYSAAVRSMSESWHAFLYGSFDATGIMTVDKPPLALWVQALSVRVFGFSAWAMLVPQALMGVATVALVYDMTRRHFGRGAGFAAGLALALTPITVAISRHNNPDALLVLCVTGAVWALVRGLDDGRTRWLVLAGISVGLGFEAKMGAALLVVPAIAAAWLWVAPRGRVAAVRQLLAGGAATTVVGLAWPVLLWLTPSASRPWISGTSDNSIWSLITGYNGLGRLFGQDGGPGGGAGGPGGGPGGVFGGDTGALRLLNEALGGQAGWLLGAALVGVAGLAVVTRLARTDARTGFVIAVGGAFLTTAVAFSRAEGIFHPYYVSALAPFTAALVGATVGVVLRDRTAAQILGPLMLAGGVVTEVMVLEDNPGSLEWLPPVLAIVAGGAGVALAMGLDAKLRAAVVAAAIGVLLLGRARRLRRRPDDGRRAARDAGRRRRRPVRRRRLVAERGRQLRRGPRRRDDRRLQPVGRGRRAHHRRRRRRGDRWVLGPREPGERRVAGGRGAGRPHPLGGHRRHRWRHAPGRSRRRDAGDGRGPAGRQAGQLGERPVRPAGAGRRVARAGLLLRGGQRAGGAGCDARPRSQATTARATRRSASSSTPWLPSGSTRTRERRAPRRRSSNA